ncbi:MAG: hypothetical protein MUP70_01460, partial [Candidatus Aminicenantes bacterium]|nr:hypothetical protein [Candidatus Aminicenantes bacterium]
MKSDHKKELPESGSPDKGGGKIAAWSGMIHSLSRLLWVLVVIVVLVVLGRLTIFRPVKPNVGLQPRNVPVVEKVDWSKVDERIQGVMKEARQEAENMASDKLEAWITAKMEKVDSDFLRWYFNYWTQQKLGLEGLLSQVVHWINSGSPSAAEAITESVQIEFANRVIRPRIAQMELERMITEIISAYSDSLRDKLSRIPDEYRIEPAAWDRYLTDLSVMVVDVEANRQIPL